ncbi:MAG: DNA-processing protein DprA [Clostridia bacterium]|nr:DNA-processing protein DprA [Clostridia bacterium]
MSKKQTETIEKWIWLSLFKKISKGKIHKLLSEFYTIDNIYDAQREDYEKLTFLKPEDISLLCEKDLSESRIYVSDLEKSNIFVLTKDMPEFPQMMNSYPNHPLILYCKGQRINLNKYISVSVVGTRNPGQYGKNITYTIASELAKKGVIIISGMAEGADSIAHEACLNANVPTVAVIGCGPDIVYPRSNASLSKKICEKGMIISEYPPGTPPERFRFPERNKIIASLSPVTAVTEAAKKSGSLITANLAKKFGNILFAVPGNITSNLSDGTNILIGEGAHPITSKNDIFNFFVKTIGEEKVNKYTYKTYTNKCTDDNPYKQSEKNKNQEINTQYLSYSDDEKENIILKCLCGNNLSIDKISYETGFSLSQLSSALLFMEIKGKIKKNPGDTYTAV